MSMRAEGFRETADMLRNMSKRFSKEIRGEIVRQFAEQVREHLVESIQGSGFAMPPLSEAYAARKRAEGRGDTPLVRTGRYLRSIRVVKARKGWSVGISANAKTVNGVPMSLLALWLEYGTKKMPARPHWRPTALWAERRWKDDLKRKLVNSVRRAR